MSRYSYPGREPGLTVSIGDRPLQTFFVQVTRDNGEDTADDSSDPGTLLWLGTAIGKLPYATDAIRIARLSCRYCVLHSHADSAQRLRRRQTVTLLHLVDLEATSTFSFQSNR